MQVEGKEPCFPSLRQPELTACDARRNTVFVVAQEVAGAAETRRLNYKGHSHFSIYRDSTIRLYMFMFHYTSNELSKKNSYKIA